MSQLPVRGSTRSQSSSLEPNPQNSLEPILASWSNAITLYNSKLTKDERKKLDTSNCPHEPFQSLRRAALTAKGKVDDSRWPCTATVQRVCAQINRYAATGDLIVQHHAEYTSLVWGALRFCLLFGVEESSMSLKISEALESCLQIVFRAEEYSKLFSSSIHSDPSTTRVFQSLQDNLTQLYAEILNFLIRATKFLEKRTWRRYVSAGLSPFDDKFQPILNKMDQCERNVEKDRNVLQAAADRLRQNYENGLWLRQVNFEADLRRLQSAHLPGTLQWFLQSDTYRTWRDTTASASNLLWIQGKPGSGKSTLASKMIEDLQSTNDSTVVYFLCKDGQEDKNSVRCILRNILFQMMERSSKKMDLHHAVEVSRLHAKSQYAESMETLWALLRKMLIIENSICCLIDGLDECADSKEEIISFISTLSTVFEHNGAKAKLAVISRLDTLYIEESSLQWSTLVLQASDLKDDIISITRSKLVTSKRLSTHPKRDYLEQKLVENADGMVLWVDLMVQELEAGHWNTAMVLSRPPRGLSAIYTSILQRIAKDKMSSDRVQHALQLVVAARRPLKIEELALCLAINEGLSSHEEYTVRGNPDQECRELILQSSPMLYLQADRSVQLSHASIRDFLLGNNIPDDLAQFRLLPSRINEQMAFTLLSYLKLELLLMNNDRFSQPALDVYPLVEYATLSLVHHCSRSGQSVELSTRLVEFFDSAQGWRWLQSTLFFNIDRPSRQMLEAELRNWSHSLDIDTVSKETLGHFRLSIPRTRFEAIGSSDCRDQEVSAIMDFKADALVDRGSWEDLKEAVEIYEEILYHDTNRLGRDHEEVRTSQYKLARSWCFLGMFQKAEKLSLEIYEAYKVELGPEDPLTVLSLSQVAHVAWKQGRLGKAAALLTQILEIERRTLGSEHPSTIINLANFGAIKKEMGLMEEAETMQRNILETHTRLLGSDHPDRLNSAHYLARSLDALGHYSEAFSIYSEVIDIKSRVYGPDHASTLLGKHDLAETMKKMGDLDGAAKLRKEVLDVRVKTLGPNHRDTLFSMGNMAITYLENENWKDLEEAERLAKLALAGLQKTQGLEDSRTPIVIYILAHIYHSQKRPEEAAQIERMLVDHAQQYFEPDDTRTLDRMINLANTLNDLEDWEPLEALQMDIVDAEERVRGPDHPDTIVAKENLAQVRELLETKRGNQEVLIQDSTAQCVSNQEAS